jgi:serine/threonine protein kinase HipA of HipAB toxin-antitoxin module/DNA-binding transcriptional ArsR family regulator
VDPPALLRVLRRVDIATAADLSATLGVSQPTVSRWVRALGRDVLVIGRGRGTRYAAYRDISGVGRSVPVFAVGPSGEARRVATLHAVGERAFWVAADAADVEPALHPDLPYFLDGLRPSGYLGRLIPRRHPELGAPGDVSLWTANHTLAYLTRHGWNAPGDFIVGEEAFQLHLQHRASPPDAVDDAERAHVYPRLAEEILEAGPAGSSAGGDQPKLLVSRAGGGLPVLVKFSPRITDESTQRYADLLIAEHLAHEVLRAHGKDACRSEILRAGERVFLEVERFDRTPARGRRGVVSLLALDAEFVGSLQTWTETARALAEQRRIDIAVVEEIRWRELFGALIANTDMHLANQSFFTSGTRLLGLTPIYDMLPMQYLPLQGHLRSTPVTLPAPRASDAHGWDSACAAALAFWDAVASGDRLGVSAAFREVATVNAARVAEARGLGQWLPRRG